MCGRYFIGKAPKSIRRNMFPEDFSETRINPFLLKPRFNIAPTQVAPVFRRIQGELVGGELKWGFRPQWMTAPGRFQINARAETVFEKPMFRQAATTQRCAVLASGWYEWQQVAGEKQPWAFHLADFTPFTIAGLWTAGRDENGKLEENFLVLTAQAGARAREVHERMPVVLDAASCATWLDPASERQDLEQCLGRSEPADLVAHRVSKRVNNPRHDAPDCIEPLSASGE